MKKFRKISSLILALVLICALASVAFAENKHHCNEEVTASGNLVTMDASITQYSVSGQIYVNDGAPMPYLYASVTYTYNVATIGGPAVTDTVTGYGGNAHYAHATKEVTANISSMHSAVYNYKADIPGESSRYIGAPIILEY